MPETNAMDQFRLDNRVALVTGGSKGLGKSMALGLAQAGATTVICSRHMDECGAVAAEIAAETGRESVGIAVDVTQEGDVDRLFDAVQQRFGRLDVLVNSAGVNIRHLIEDFPTDDFRQVIDINLTGTWFCCRAAGRIMKPQGKASVINIGSALSAVGLVERTAYCASKAGILGLTRTLALEWAPSGIRCNAICPGPFLTEINKPLLEEPEKLQAIVEQTALSRLAELHEIQGVAIFLASDASSYMTGSALYVDGGWTAQ